MRKYLCVAFGLLLILSSIWGGAYGMSAYPYGHWANFPIYFTALVGFLGGMCQMVFAANMMDKK